MLKRSSPRTLKDPITPKVSFEDIANGSQEAAKNLLRFLITSAILILVTGIIFYDNINPVFSYIMSSVTFVGMVIFVVLSRYKLLELDARVFQLERSIFRINVVEED